MTKTVTKDKKLDITLPQLAYKALRTLQTELNLSQGEIIQECIRRALDRKEAPSPRESQHP